MILVAATSRGRAPGTIYVIEPDLAAARSGTAAVDEAVGVVLDLVAAAASGEGHHLVTKEWSHVPGHSR